MSVPVELEKLRDAIGSVGRPAYLLTVNPDSRPHAVAVEPQWADDGTFVVTAGKRTVGNASDRSDVSLLWPPSEEGGYSLIADAVASSEGDGQLRLRPVKAVFHRAATGPVADGCTSDCITVLPRATSA